VPKRNVQLDDVLRTKFCCSDALVVSSLVELLKRSGDPYPRSLRLDGILLDMLLSVLIMMQEIVCAVLSPESITCMLTYCRWFVHCEILPSQH
jgi:hypothetical protein